MVGGTPRCLPRSSSVRHKVMSVLSQCFFVETSQTPWEQSEVFEGGSRYWASRPKYYDSFRVFIPNTRRLFIRPDQNGSYSLAVTIMATERDDLKPVKSRSIDAPLAFMFNQTGRGLRG